MRLEPEDVEVRATSHEELALAQDGGVAVALDTRVDHDLKLEGLAREVIRVLNDRRKAQGLEIADRIEVWLAADGDVAEAVRRHRDVDRGRGAGPGAAPRDRRERDGIRADRGGRRRRRGEDRAGLGTQGA